MLKILIVKNLDIKFADEHLKEIFTGLQESKTEDKKLYGWINKTLDKLEEDAFSGIQIPKNLFPKEYIQKYGIDNLWKCDLPQGWRLLYTVGNDGVVVLSIILKWMDHKNQKVFALSETFGCSRNIVKFLDIMKEDLDISDSCHRIDIRKV